MHVLARFSWLILFAPCVSLASNPSHPSHLPKEFMFGQHPIDPLCIYEAKGAETLIDLNKCGLDAERGRKITGKNNKLIKQGYYGYDYTWPGNPPVAGSSYYKVLGKIDDRFLIISYNNTGGSGDFSGISAVERKGHSIRVQSLLNGDRCNGGIKNASLDGNSLLYTINITASDYLSLANENPNHLKAYDDLAACAACCEGTANFRVDNLQEIATPNLMSIELGKDNIIPDKNKQGVYQYCFDQLLTTYQAKQQTLTPALLQEFAQRFNQECVKG